MNITPIRRSLLAAALLAASSLTVPAIGGVAQADDKMPATDRSSPTYDTDGSSRTSDADSSSRTYDTDGDGTRRSVGQTVSDQALETRVKTALIDADSVKARNIEVEVRNGVVSLSGTVDSKSEASTAVSVARNVEGVKSVDSKLTAQDGTR
jgi:osmotically-inducible protein OsmY